MNKETDCFENVALLACFAAQSDSYRSFGVIYRSETSATNYQPAPRNIQEERRFL